MGSEFLEHSWSVRASLRRGCLKADGHLEIDPGEECSRQRAQQVQVQEMEVRDTENRTLWL